MAEVYLGQIMLTGFNFAQRGFALCNGQLLPLQQNAALFSLLGVQYGGNGTTNFALPNLQSRTPVGAGTSADPAWTPPAYVQGQPGGLEAVTVLPTQLPAHGHMVNATNVAGTVKNPADAIYGGTGTESVYGSAASNPVQLASALGPAGNNQPHDNMQPFRVINFNIALSGIFPARS
jgi:microcystin-dependent protein